MNEYERGYKDAQVKIIQNMYDVEGEWLTRECFRLEKEIGLPAQEIATIIKEYRAKLVKEEFDQIVAESDSKEEAVYHLTISLFLRDYIKKNLNVTDEFIDHCMNDDKIAGESANAVYNKLKNKKHRSKGEEEFYKNYTEGLEIGYHNARLKLVKNMYNAGKSTEDIKDILKLLDFTEEDIESLIEEAKQKKE